MKRLVFVLPNFYKPASCIHTTKMSCVPCLVVPITKKKLFLKAHIFHSADERSAKMQAGTALHPSQLRLLSMGK